MTSIADLQKYVEKRAGENIMKTGREAPPIGYISTGVFLLNFALLGGYPEGRISTIVGQKHSGKTTLCHKAVAGFQKKYNGVSRPKRRVAWIDTEQSYDPLWAAKNGVNVDELVLIQPPDGDSAADIWNACLENDDIGLVILDSLANLVGVKEIEKSVEDQTMAPVATIAQRMLRKSSTIIAKANAQGITKTGMIINQWREKPTMMGDPRNLPGGKYVRFYSTLEMEVYNKKQVVEKDEHEIDSIAYNEQAFKIMKNRAGNSIMEGEFIMNRRVTPRLAEADIDDFDVVVRYAQKFGFVQGQGPKWSLTHPYTGEVIDFKGKGVIGTYLEEHRDVYEDLQRKMISIQRAKQGLSENNWW
jgi:recombination protein RecA